MALASADGIPTNPTAPMYKVGNVTEMINNGLATATKIRATGVGTKQLAFDLAGTTLWAHDHNNCWWSKVDTSTGAVTDEFQGAACLRDIGGAACAAGCALVERYLSPRPQPGAQSPPVVSPSDASHRHSPRQFGLRTTQEPIGLMQMGVSRLSHLPVGLVYLRP